MLQNNYNFDSNPYNTHMLLLGNIPDGSRVLEIGTASGYLGEYLIKKKNCEVWGVEPSYDLCKDAEKAGYAKIFCKDAETLIKNGDLDAQLFDRILLGDVLEHMVEPQIMLKLLLKFLKPNGQCVISLPNVANYKIRWQLLCGSWDVKDAGILDRTHLRFFTKKTMRKMIEGAGYQILNERPSGGQLERFGLNKLFGVGKKLLFCWPEFFAEQFIFSAKSK